MIKKKQSHNIDIDINIKLMYVILYYKKIPFY
jgi:hypothetical protein